MRVIGWLGRTGVLLAALLLMCQAAFADKVPFRMVDGHPLIIAHINGRPAVALIDTGAAASYVDESLAADLGIGALWKLAAEDAAGPQVRNDRTVPANITIGAVVTEEKTLGLENVGAIFGGLPDGEAQPQAIIGLDVLKNYVIEIDFDRSVIGFTKAGEYRAFPKEGALVLTNGSGLRMLRIALDGKWADAVIDTGATSAVHLSIAFEAREGILAGQRASEVLVSGVDGLHRRPITSLETIEFAGRAFSNVPVTLSAQPIGSNIDAVVGMQVLSRFNLVLDFSRWRMWMKPNASFGKPFRRDRVGLSTRNEEGGRVVLVASGSPADKAGFRIGEIVTEMRDEDGAKIDSGRDTVTGQKVTVVMGDGSTRLLVAEEYY
jgi:predicted aspartyl protease